MEVFKMVKILHMILPVWVLVLNALFQSHTMYKNKHVPHFVNNGVWVAVMCQCRFISFNKCTIMVGLLIMEEAANGWDKGVYGKFLYIPFSFAAILKLL